MSQLFFAGRTYTTPATLSAIDDSALAGRGVAVGNTLALIGVADSGQPKTPLNFSSYEDAKAQLVSGPVLDAVRKCFDPSRNAGIGAPTSITVLQPRPLTQATLALKAGAAPVVNLASTLFGLPGNGTSVKVEAGTRLGQKLTVKRASATYVTDNIARDALTVTYGGAASSASITVSGDTVTLAAPTNTTVATLSLSLIPTVQSLADQINSVPGFAATVAAGSANKSVLNALDYVNAQSVLGAGYKVTANLQAFIDAVNAGSYGLLVASRPAGAGSVPDAVPYTALTGGTAPAAVMQDWMDCYTALQTEDVQWVVPLSGDPAIHAANDAHCQYMSTIARMERRGICGTPLATSDSSAIALAAAINSDRTSLVHIGYYDYDANGSLTLFDPFQTAALIAACFAGASPGTAMTNKTINVRGLERKLRNPVDTDALIAGNVLCVESTKKGYKVTQSITTWAQNDNYNRCEVSTGVALDYTARTVREAVDDLRGSKGSPVLIGQIINRAESALRSLAVAEPNGPGVLAGDANSPAYKGITVTINGDVASVSFECSPVIPNNFIPITVHAQPYSGTATL